MGFQFRIVIFYAPIFIFVKSGVMNNLTQMRLGVLRELKNIHKFFDMMEKGVKSRDPIKVQRAYLFIEKLVFHMDEGDLTPTMIELYEAFSLLDDY